LVRAFCYRFRIESLSSRQAVVTDTRFSATANAGKVRNAFLTESFGCDPEEDLLGSFPCTSDHASGHLYVTTKSLCFDPLLGGGSTDSKNKRFRLPIDSVSSMTKFRVVFVPTGLRIRTKDERDYSFAGLLERKKCVALLQERGPSIELVSQRMTDGLGGDITDSKNESFHKRFHKQVPKSESLLRQIDCVYHYFPPGQNGHLYVTENYVCFWSLITPVVVMRFPEISAITMAKGRGFSAHSNNGLEISSGDKVYKFSGLSERYLSNDPPFWCLLSAKLTQRVLRDMVHKTLVQMWQVRRS
jgi:GRAM domain